MASVLTNTLFSMAGQMAARVLALVFYAVMARLMGPDRYGDQGFGAAVGTLFVVLLEPGLNPLMVRDGAHDRAVLESRLKTLLGYKLLALVVVWPASVGLTWAMGYRDHALWAVLFAGGTILWGALEDTCAAALIALERLDLESSLRVTSKVLTAGLGTAVLLTGQAFEVVLGAVCLGAALASLTGLVFVRRGGLKVGVSLDTQAMTRGLAESWPLALHNVMWLLTLRMDQVLASQLGVPHDALGNYNAAVKLLEALVLFPTAVASAFQARLARAYKTQPDVCSQQLQLALGATMALCLPVAVGGGLLATGLSSLVYGDRFGGTGPLLAIQLWCLPLLGFQALGSFAMQAAGRVRLQALTTLANLCVNLACNLLLVPRYGVMGASLAAVAGGVAACLVYLWGLRVCGLRTGLLHAVWRPLLGCIAMAGTLFLSSSWHLPVLVDVALGGAAFALVFLGVGGKQVLRDLRQARQGD
jgi:O-antigen/teichoic acid export membrane protein